MESKSLLEPDFAPHYNAWKATPTPKLTTALLNKLQPTMDRAVSAHIGQNNPILKSRAKQMALGALRSYDPYQAKLSTHLFNQLQGLKRVSRKQTQVIGVPERISLAQGQMLQAEAELQERLGREPTNNELADHTGLSLKRLRQIRQAPSNAMPEGYYQSLGDEAGGEGGWTPGVMSGPTDAYLELVHGDLTPDNQFILEATLGLHGRKKLSNQQIAAKLGLTPGAVSQRKAIIQRMMDEQQSSGIFG